MDLKALGEEHLLESVPLGILHPAEREREGKRETERGGEGGREGGREEGGVYMYISALFISRKDHT